MDFGTLLQTANSNNSGRNGGNYYKTKFEPPKKESKNKNLSSNIQKFLAKKEEEERLKAAELRQKRDELLSKRDTKANNKIKKMLKVIKSANKSVLDDAVNNVNTAVTMQGPDQPDEDDYGYVSREASDFYSKMMEKYKNIPDKDKFSASKKNVNHDLENTKDRVKASFLREREEELSPHKRKRKSNQAETEEYDEPVKSASKAEEKPKPKRPQMPPPLDYSELIKIAAKKQFEPVVIETKKPETIDEPERPMTKRQRREYEEEKAMKEARMRREKDRAAGLSGSQRQQTESSNKQTPKITPAASMRIPKLSDKINKPSVPSSSKTPDPPSRDDRSKSYKKEEIDNKNKAPIPRNSSPSIRTSNAVDKTKTAEPPLKKSKENPPIRSEPPKQIKSSNNIDRRKLPNNENRLKTTTPIGKSEKVDTNPFRTAPTKSSVIAQKNSSDRSQTVKSNPSINNKPKTQMPLNNKQTPNSGQKPQSLQSNNKSALQDRRPQIQQSGSAKTAKLDPKGVRQFPPKDVQRPRQFPPADVRGPRQFPPRDVQLKKQKLAKRRIMDDDDSEYDSSLDDFIDDGPEEGSDVSKYIKEIFGYDKSRYRDMDDDDKNMESNYSQVMREEYISKKMGIMEDLEDMKLEAMEKQKKSQQKKRKLK